MTVRELQDKLKDKNPEAKIIVFDLEENEIEIIGVLDYKTQVHLIGDMEPRDR